MVRGGGPTMAWDRREIIGLLRLEIENIRQRGFGPYFRDSVLCINAGKTLHADPCDQCLLLEFVPEEARKEPVPCYHIPLNAAGETVASLHGQPAAKQLEAAVLGWMEATASRLEKEFDDDRVRKAR